MEGHIQQHLVTSLSFISQIDSQCISKLVISLSFKVGIIPNTCRDIGYLVGSRFNHKALVVEYDLTHILNCSQSENVRTSDQLLIKAHINTKHEVIGLNDIYISIRAWIHGGCEDGVIDRFAASGGTHKQENTGGYL